MDINKMELNQLDRALNGNQYHKELAWCEENKPSNPDNHISRTMSVGEAERINNYRRFYE